MIEEFLGLFILLLLSGFFSSSELAFVVSNKLKIEIRAKQNKFAARNAHYYINNSDMFFSTILIANNIINIAFASLITIFLTSLFGFSDLAILLISTLLLLLFGELIPKYFAREYADRLVILNSIPLRAVTFLIYPLAKITSSLSSFIVREDELKAEAESIDIEKEDFQNLVDESTEVGEVGEELSDLFTKVMELGDQKVYETMTPRTDIIGVDISASIEDLLSVLIDSGYSKIPVYEENIDNIKGVVFANALFENPVTILDILKPVKFVPETKKALDMMNEFLDERVSVAMVVDEYGGTAGIVTVEDIIEEMFGEIQDEYDVQDLISKKISNNAYLFSGKVEIDQINDEYDLEIPSGDYETLAGFITAEIGRIPVKGESIEIDEFKINILRSEINKINLIRLYKLDKTS